MNPKKLFNNFYLLSNVSQFLIVLLLILIIGYFDYLLPSEMSVRLFYLLPLFLFSWRDDGLKQGLLLSILTALTNLYSDYMSGVIYRHNFYAAWELLITWGFFVIFVFTIVEIKKTNSLLAEKNKSLQEANKAKDDLLIMVSHDLKNPLSNIIGSTSLIIDGDNLPAEDVKQLIEYIYLSSKRMSLMIDEYLQINSKNKKETMGNIRDIDLNILVTKLVNEYEYKSRSKNISIKFLQKPNLMVECDAFLTYQVLDNLLSNAIKYSPHEKNVLVNIDNATPPGEQSENQFISVEIKDEGPGFTEEDKTKIFNEVAILSAKPTGNESSTGHGLSIAKKLVEKMNGKIWFESEAGKGTSFFIALKKSGKIDSINFTI